jgi:hypothetical protein
MKKPTDIQRIAAEVARSTPTALWNLDDLIKMEFEVQDAILEALLADRFNSSVK